MKKLLPLICLLAMTTLFSACSKGGKPTEAEAAVEQDAFLNKIVIYELEFVNVDGQPWDMDGSGPDVRVALVRPGSATPRIITPVNYNTRAINLPITWNIEDDDIQITENEWKVVLYDEDDQQLQEMYSWTISPAEAELSYELEGGETAVYDLALQTRVENIESGNDM